MTAPNDVAHVLLDTASVDLDAALVLVHGNEGADRDVLVILLPILIVLSTLLFLLVIFLILTIVLRRRRGISLGDSDGPIDLSRDEFADGAGGFAGVESRWLENVDAEAQRLYQRAKDYQQQYPPNSQPTDITLSQFLSIQEKGVSAWSFEPDYEFTPSVLVHARTELTFLPDPLSTCSVQSNLPLPKLNEVYYWEVKMFDLPTTTNVSIGLATKPYPPFRLPGLSRFSIAYHSNGDKSHNYPFTAQPFGPSLKEGDVLGIGYRPRSGTVFFTRNGRKTEDAFVGLSRWNLFPTIGADGPCSVHVNLGQMGFVHIEANVKKWGLAPSVGTLAPPPAYGSERGSILLQAGGTPSSSSPIPGSRRSRREERSPPPSIDEIEGTPGQSSSMASSVARRSMRSARRAAHAHAHSLSNASAATPIQPSPLRVSSPPSSSPNNPLNSSARQPSTIDEEDPFADRRSPSHSHSRSPSSASAHRYISPTDIAYQASQRPPGPSTTLSSELTLAISPESNPDVAAEEEWDSASDSSSGSGSDLSHPSREIPAVQEVEHSPESSPVNPPTPHISDIHLREIHRHSHSHSHSSSRSRHRSTPSGNALPTTSPSSSLQSSASFPNPNPTSTSPTTPTQPRPSSQPSRVPSDPPPPEYTIVDPARYPHGLTVAIPEDILAAALADPPGSPTGSGGR